MLGQTRDVGITPGTPEHNTEVSYFPSGHSEWPAYVASSTYESMRVHKKHAQNTTTVAVRILRDAERTTLQVSATEKHYAKGVVT